MAKIKVSATTDLSDFVTDLIQLAGGFSNDIKQAAEKQLDYTSKAVRDNWNSMNPWQGTDTANLVSDSIGYNVSFGDTGDTVGMVGVFQIDSIASRYGRTKHDITAPQFAYWVEYGFNPNNSLSYSPVPFMSSAYYATLDKQDEIFADTLAARMNIIFYG